MLLLLRARDGIPGLGTVCVFRRLDNNKAQMTGYMGSERGMLVSVDWDAFYSDLICL
jgi:hypothetical protein